MFVAIVNNGKSLGRSEQIKLLSNKSCRDSGKKLKKVLMEGMISCHDCRTKDLLITSLKNDFVDNELYKSNKKHIFKLTNEESIALAKNHKKSLQKLDFKYAALIAAESMIKS